MSYVFKKSGENYVLDQKAEIHEQLQNGVYKISTVPNVGIVFSPLQIKKDHLIRIENSTTDEILKFVENFITPETKARYKQCKTIHKTGILLHGLPGSGKTGILNMAIDELIKMDAIVFFDAEPALVAAVLPAVRQQNPEKLICIVFEEFDEWLGQQEATINSFLDGQLSVENMIVLATTNYISKIPSRLKNRNSRFQIVKEIGRPSKEFRQAWFTAKLKDIGHEDKIQLFVDQSDEMVIDQMKELIVGHLALNIPLHDVVQKIKEMAENGVGIEDAVESDYRERLREEMYRSLFTLPKGLTVKLKDDMD